MAVWLITKVKSCINQIKLEHQGVKIIKSYSVYNYQTKWFSAMNWINYRNHCNEVMSTV